MFDSYNTLGEGGLNSWTLQCLRDMPPYSNVEYDRQKVNPVPWDVDPLMLDMCKLHHARGTMALRARAITGNLLRPQQPR